MTRPRGTLGVAGQAPLPVPLITRVVDGVLRGERRRADVSLTFVGRDRMRKLNHDFLDRQGVTDVIAFALRGPAGALAADVYICPWQVRRAAARYRVPIRQELVRVIVHGVLHGLGHDHPEGAGRDTCPMWRRQERYVAALA